MEISNLCNHCVAKKSKAGPPGAESSGGESTIFSANFAEAIHGKQAVKNCFLFVCSPRFWVLLFQDTKNSPFYAMTKMKNVCYSHDCRKIEGSQKLLHKCFSWNCWVSFRKVDFHFTQKSINLPHLLGIVVSAGQNGEFEWLRWFLSVALRIPTAHDFCIISVRKKRVVERVYIHNIRDFPQAKAWKRNKCLFSLK